jgi:hypothetical protein
VFTCLLDLSVPTPRVLLALAVLIAPTAAQDAAGDGFALSSLTYPGQSLSATFSNGDVLSFDGNSIDRWSADGTHLVNYASLFVPVFASFVALDASEAYALIGENSNGSVSRLDFSSGQLAPLATLNLNFDCVQRDATNWYISAATCGFNCGNEIWSLDATSGATQLEVQVDGPSGPLAIDASGNLYYATQSGVFPALPGSTNVLFFLAWQLAGASVLTNADAFTVGAGFDAGNDLLYDAVASRLYLAENNFGTGSNRVYRVGPTAALSELVVDGAPFRYISNLELFQHAGPSIFAPYQPADGGRMLYNTTDFFSAWERNEVRPQRPDLALSGAGASGAGLLDIAVQAGTRNGFALFAAAPTSAVAGSESTLPLPSATPLLSPFDLGQTVLLPGVSRLDAQGAVTISVPHQGDLLGLLSLQALLFDSNATPAATTGVANL